MHEPISPDDLDRGEGLLPNRGPVKWSTTIGIVLVHLLGLGLGYFYFTWTGLIVAAVMTFIMGGLGVSMCYHRFLTHSSYRTSKKLGYVLSWFATMAMQGGPVRWVATHTLHHQESDDHDDPHSPLMGFFWAHVLWTCFHNPMLQDEEDLAQYTNLHKDPVLNWLDKYPLIPFLVTTAVFFGAGFWIGGFHLAMSLVVWGLFLAIVYVWHVTWLVNSAAHTWGYRNYDTPDNSRNLWWVALLSWGEGWHNNHHGKSNSANFSRKWYEIDPIYWVIIALEKVGLVRQVKVAS